MLPFVLLAYLDESYDATTYWIVAVIVDEETVARLGPDLDQVVSDAAAKYGTSSSAELHGHALFHGKDDWERLVLMPRLRVAIYRSVFDTIASHPVTVVFRGVHVPGLNRRYRYPDHPHAVVLAHLLERIDDIAQSRMEYALVIADQVDQADSYRQHLWDLRQAGIQGYSRKLTQIIDTMHFVPSRASRPVQAADMIVYLKRRMHAGQDLDARAIRANDSLWGLIDDQIHPKSGCWYP